jgi:hypothetical protein
VAQSNSISILSLLPSREDYPSNRSINNGAKGRLSEKEEVEKNMSLSFS